MEDIMSDTKPFGQEVPFVEQAHTELSSASPGELSQPNSQPPLAQEPLPTPIAPKQNSLVRLLTRPATWRWGLVVVGLLLAIVGGILIYSATSQSSSTYQSTQGKIVLIGFSGKSGDSYLGLDNGKAVYFNENDFTPTPPSLDLGNYVAFIYQPDKTVDLSTVLPELQGTAYKAVQITVFDSSGQNPKVFTSSEYSQGSGSGIALLIVGLVIAALAFGVPLIRGRLGKNKQAPSLEGAPAMATGASVATEMPTLPDLGQQPEPSQPSD